MNSAMARATLPYHCPICGAGSATGPEHVDHVNGHRATPTQILECLRAAGFGDIADLLEQS